MKRVQWLTQAAVVALVAAVAAQAVAQGPTVPMTQARPQAPGVSASGAIALLDVTYVFKNHARFKALMAELQADVDAAEASVKKDQGNLKALAERLEGYRAGTPEYKQLEEELAKRQSDMAVQVQLQKKDFLQREAKIYHNVYQELMQEVDYYAANNGIALVMRFNGDTVDASKPEDVLRDINKPIVWYPKDRDITPFILQRVNRPEANPVNRGAAQRTGVPTMPR